MSQDTAFGVIAQEFIQPACADEETLVDGGEPLKALPQSEQAETAHDTKKDTDRETLVDDGSRHAPVKNLLEKCSTKGMSSEFAAEPLKTLPQSEQAETAHDTTKDTD